MYSCDHFLRRTISKHFPKTFNDIHSGLLVIRIARHSKTTRAGIRCLHSRSFNNSIHSHRLKPSFIRILIRFVCELLLKFLLFFCSFPRAEILHRLVQRILTKIWCLNFWKFDWLLFGIQIGLWKRRRLNNLLEGSRVIQQTVWLFDTQLVVFS